MSSGGKISANIKGFINATKKKESKTEVIAAMLDKPSDEQIEMHNRLKEIELLSKAGRRKLEDFTHSCTVKSPEQKDTSFEDRK